MSSFKDFPRAVQLEIKKQQKALFRELKKRRPDKGRLIELTEKVKSLTGQKKVNF